MSRAQRTKGARGEREFAALLREFGFVASRNARNGLSTEDVAHDVAGVHFEVKRCERIEMPKWIRQALANCGGLVPAVAHRRSREPWWVTIPASEYLRLKQLDDRLIPPTGASA